jgi:hypothetical protein
MMGAAAGSADETPAAPPQLVSSAELIREADNPEPAVPGAVSIDTGMPGLGEQDGSAPAPQIPTQGLIGLRDDYFVALQPLSLDFIATQLDRLNIRYTLGERAITSGWTTFDVSFSLFHDWLNVRATFRQAFPATAAAALAGRCNWWNSKYAFLSASSTLTTGTLRIQKADGEDDDESPAKSVPIAKIHLDLGLPLTAGIAPAQFQALHGELIQNILLFERKAQLNELIAESAWLWE